jgi:DNA-nicking Smr family endonuclease
MAKKKKTPVTTEKFQGDPFSDLRGFAASAPEPEAPAKALPEPLAEPELSGEELFDREMNLLGVRRSSSEETAEKRSAASEPRVSPPETMSDQDQFLAALGEMSVRFEDHLPDAEEPPQASPRRMKLLKQGRLQPEATLDLHGMLRHQVVEKVRFFLEGGKFQGYRTVLIITGRGLHSQGEPVLRSEVERFLRNEGRALAAEWARAPRQYGGDGALIVFLKGNSSAP